MEPLFEVSTHYSYNELRRYDTFALTCGSHYYLRLFIVFLCFEGIGFGIMIGGSTTVGVSLMLGVLLGFGVRVTLAVTGAPKRVMKSPMFDKYVTLRFYEEHLTTDHDKNHSEFSYTQISRVHETERCFYIIVNGVGAMLVVKKNCSAELMEQIRGLSPKRKK